VVVLLPFFFPWGQRKSVLFFCFFSSPLGLLWEGAFCFIVCNLFTKIVCRIILGTQIPAFHPPATSKGAAARGEICVWQARKRDGGQSRRTVEQNGRSNERRNQTDESDVYINQSVREMKRDGVGCLLVCLSVTYLLKGWGRCSLKAGDDGPVRFTV